MKELQTTNSFSVLLNDIISPRITVNIA